ncbi:hypothetical protein F383_07303 [Gossypium arboreum]|uniref:Uncharacterized protein n=1 Tax=Gossypium arboreum TaxID=29729 RepID=A0A0B0NSN2_GOSAR|nr:hypothetical protein F383_20065 [Gossypium arboreum]KHG14784.1 hypothetical protein F383_07303 [Gossypium arboreum]
MEAAFISSESTLKDHSHLYIHISSSDLDGEDKGSHRCIREDSTVQRRHVKEAPRGAAHGSPNFLAYSGTFQKLLVLLR